jgi:hypothetical protein
MKNYNYTVGNRTCNLPTCSTVPQPTAPPRVPKRGIASPIVNLGTRLRMSGEQQTPAALTQLLIEYEADWAS